MSRNATSANCGDSAAGPRDIVVTGGARADSVRWRRRYFAPSHRLQNCQLRFVGPASSDMSLCYRVLLTTDLAAIHGLHPQEGACCRGCQLRTSK